MNTVIFHNADYDGIFCREIARHFLPTDTKFIGWNFGDKPLPIPNDPDIITYVLDLPCDRVFGLTLSPDPVNLDLLPWKNLVWIDHHKSSIESHPLNLSGYRIDGVAACRLAWQWFSSEFGPNNPFCHPVNYVLPVKKDYTDRKVSEPLAVLLAGEYDVWDHRGDGDVEFQFGLRLVEQGSDFWEALFDTGEVGKKAVEELLENGRIAQRYSAKTDADLVLHRSFRLNWEGLDFLCLNHGKFNSLTFAALDKPETGHDALLGFMWNGKVWTVSLYHAAHRTDIDLSEIAVKYGGGGHKGACGFTCDKLPFLNI